MPASADFRLSITLALTSQLRDALAVLTPAPLTRANLDALERRKGVYQLYHRGTLVYVGSAKTRLPTRLGQHLRKISGRENIDLTDMAFTCLYVEEDMTVLSPEHNLMEGFKADGFCAWNYNGFGNKDPGVERDTTVLEPEHWDMTYPVDLSLPVGAIAAGEHDLETFMKELKGELPFNFRYQKKGPAIADYDGLRVTVPTSGMTARRLFEAIVAVLPPGWHAWVLPGYVILYKNDRNYPQGRRIQP